MASLRDIVKDYQDELRTGIVWVAFWKEGRSWNADYFYLELNDYLYPHDISRLEEIRPRRDCGKRLLFRLSGGGHEP